MTPPSDIPSDGQPASPARQHFLQRLVELSIKPTARDAPIQPWGMSYELLGKRDFCHSTSSLVSCVFKSSVSLTTAFFDALGRSTHLYDWQFRGERRRPAGCVWHPAAHSSARVQSMGASRPIQSSPFRTVQDLLGHADVSTTMIYLHVIKRPGAGGPSPLDLP